MNNNTIAFDSFMSQLEEVINLPNDLFENEESVSATELIFKGALNDPTTKNQIIDELISVFSEEQASKEDVYFFLDNLEQSFKTYLENFTSSEGKKRVMHAVIDSTLAICREGADRYLGANEIKLAFELVRDGARVPAFAHDYDACADIYAPEDMIIPPHSFGTIVPTGFKMALPRGWKATISSRSGMAVKTQLRVANAPGQIDAGYLDEVGVIFDNFSEKPYVIHKGDRIAQMAIMPVHSFAPTIVEDITTASSMNRGGGYGSSGN